MDLPETCFGFMRSFCSVYINPKKWLERQLYATSKRRRLKRYFPVDDSVLSAFYEKCFPYYSAVGTAVFFAFFN
jgi:hypothetical protein